jgi:hypothetical protein
LPRLTPYSGSTDESGGFSLELYLKHREWNALLGVVGMMAALIVRLMLF